MRTLGGVLALGCALVAARPARAAGPMLADIAFPTATVRVVVLPPATPLPRAGRDAFSAVPARTTAELLAAIRANPRLRRLYARHFGIPEARVMEFVRDALVLSALPEDRTVTTWGVTRGGKVYPVRQRMRKGTLVWATRSGQLILKWLCSNPLGNALPGTRVTGRPRTVTPRTLDAPVRPRSLTGDDIPPVDASIPLPTTLALVPADALLPPPDDEVPLPAPPLSGSGSASVPATLRRLPGALSLALPIVALGGPVTIRPHPTAIPEPPSLGLLALGGLAAWGLRRARRGGG